MSRESARASGIVAIAVAVLSACNPLPDAFHCTSSTQCTASGTAGACESDGYCSAADPGCPSGRRYVAAGDLDGQCVAGGDGGGGLCSTFTGLACEGFEGATVGSAWQIYVPNASYARDSTRAARGDASGHFQLMASPALGSTYGELGNLTGPTTGTIATRAFFFFPTLPPYSGSRLIAVRQTTGSFLHISLNFDQSKLSLHSSITNSYRQSAVDLPTGRWVCFELVVTYGQAGTVRSYLDGQELSSLRLDETTLATPPASALFLGLAIEDPGTPTPAYDYWIDEVALDTTRIGCAR